MRGHGCQANHKDYDMDGSDRVLGESAFLKENSGCCLGNLGCKKQISKSMQH